MSDIISFDLAKINRGRKKLCSCTSPHYEIDPVNRLVMCTDCGSLIDPFDALLSLASRMEEVEQLQERMLQKADAYKTIADEEMQRMIKNRIFRQMDSSYKKGLYPVCPNCDSVFDPVKIIHWTSSKGKDNKNQ